VNNRPRLGRGLAALLGTEQGGVEASSLDHAELVRIPVDQIDPNPYQPRREFGPGELSALADSLRQHGMIQPILVRQVGERYQLIAGERRHRASIEAHLHEVPARVMDLDDQRVCELAIVENLQREDLNAIEKANAFKHYIDTYGGSQEELASRLGLERPTISNLIRLLSLPQEVQDAVRYKSITSGHARALLGLTDPEAQRGCCRRIIAEGLSVRQAEALVATGDPHSLRPKVRKDPAHPDATPREGKAPHFVEWEDHLKQRFGTPVSFRVKGPDRGQIVIEFQNREELDRVMGLIRG
jgi:ParB family chromosome partitioning protein